MDADPMGLPPEFWRRFHRQFDNQQPGIEQGEGSGIIIRKNGFILTNRHVVEGADKVQVRLLDGRVFSATVRGVDQASDVAVIKIDADNLPVAALGDSSKVRVGEFAIAIGVPFSLDYTVTFGHISAKGRSNVIPFYSGGNSMDQDFLQTDANINPGNSGGPLVNIDGEVIGVNTLIRGLRTGIGFAVPINLASQVADKLITDGKFARPWLGIEIRGLKEDTTLESPAKGVQDGVAVRTILPDGPAAHSDLRAGDVILSIDGRPVSTSQQLRNEVRTKAIGQSVKLDVARAGKKIQFEVKPGEYTEPAPAFAETIIPASTNLPGDLGLTFETLTPKLAEQAGVSSITKGVLVTSIATNNPSLNSDLRTGDVITSINHEAITTSEEFAKSLKVADLKKGAFVTFIRKGTAQFRILKTAEHSR
jgi:serine protease Do